MSAPLNADLSTGDPLGGDLAPALPGARSLYYMAVERELWPSGDFAGFLASLQGIEEPVDAQLVDADGEVPVRARLDALAAALEASKAREEALAEQVAALETRSAWQGTAWQETGGVSTLDGSTISTGVLTLDMPTDYACLAVQVKAEGYSEKRLTCQVMAPKSSLDATAATYHDGMELRLAVTGAWTCARTLPVRGGPSRRHHEYLPDQAIQIYLQGLPRGEIEARIDAFRARLLYQPAPTP